MDVGDGADPLANLLAARRVGVLDPLFMFCLFGLVGWLVWWLWCLFGLGEGGKGVGAEAWWVEWV